MVNATGTVQFVAAKGGYGFIKGDGAEKDDFFVVKSVVGRGVAKGDRVNYKRGAPDPKKGKGGGIATEITGGSIKDLEAWKKKLAREGAVLKLHKDVQQLQKFREEAEPKIAKIDGLEKNFQAMNSTLKSMKSEMALGFSGIRDLYWSGSRN